MTPLIYVPLFIMVVVYSLMIYRINRFIGKLLQHQTDKSTVLNSLEASSFASSLNRFDNEQPALIDEDETNTNPASIVKY